MHGWKHWVNALFAREATLFICLCPLLYQLVHSYADCDTRFSIAHQHMHWAKILHEIFTSSKLDQKLKLGIYYYSALFEKGWKHCKRQKPQNHAFSFKEKVHLKQLNIHISADNTFNIMNRNFFSPWNSLKLVYLELLLLISKGVVGEVMADAKRILYQLEVLLVLLQISYWTR